MTKHRNEKLKQRGYMPLAPSSYMWSEATMIARASLCLFFHFRDNEIAQKQCKRENRHFEVSIC